ncbi:MAG: alpha/beta hydrolase [Polyangiaceae bacterium]
MTTSHDHVVTAADGTRIAWTAHGQGAPGGAAFVLTNGLSTTENFWRPLVGGLADHRALATWRYRGHGDSESAKSGDYRVATHADDLARVTEAARRAFPEAVWPPVHVGFSMGVRVVLELRKRRPDLVGGLVLVAGGAGAPYASSPVFRSGWAGKVARTFVDTTAKVLPKGRAVLRPVLGSTIAVRASKIVGAIGRAVPDEDVQHFFGAVGDMDLVAYGETLRDLMTCRAGDVLGDVDVPTLIVVPEHDVMALQGDLRELREGIPSAKSFPIPGTGHAILLEAGEAIVRRVRTFVEGLERSRAT